MNTLVRYRLCLHATGLVGTGLGMFGAFQAAPEAGRLCFVKCVLPKTWYDECNVVVLASCPNMCLSHDCFPKAVGSLDDT